VAAGIGRHISRLKSKVSRMKRRAEDERQADRVIDATADAAAHEEQLARSGKAIARAAEAPLHAAASAAVGDGKSTTGASGSADEVTPAPYDPLGGSGGKKRKKHKGVQGALAEQKRLKHEQEMAATAAAAEAAERAKLRAQHREQKAHWTSKLKQRSRRGQPIMSHQVDHILAKLQKGAQQ